MTDEPVYTAKPRSIRATDPDWEDWGNKAGARGTSRSALIRTLMTNLGSVLTEGDELPSSSREGTSADGPVPPSVNTEETILVEATALIRDKDGVQHRVDLLDSSESAEVLKASDGLCAKESSYTEWVQIPSDPPPVAAKALEKLAKVQALKTEREFHPDPKPAGRKKKR